MNKQQELSRDEFDKLSPEGQWELNRWLYLSALRRRKPINNNSMAAKRKDGYYWVRLVKGGKWEIALFDNIMGWKLFENDEYWSDHYFMQIEKTRITRITRH